MRAIFSASAMAEFNEDRIGEMPIRSEDIGYDPADLTRCPQCERPNAPNRAKCMYCAAELPLSGDGRRSAKADLRRPESWENGFNIIYLPTLGDGLSADIAGAAKHLGIEEETLLAIADSQVPLPAARFGSIVDAELVLERISETGVSAMIIADAELRADVPPKRLRGLEIGDTQLSFKLFNTPESVTAEISNVRTIVKGVVRTTKSETREKRKKKEMSVVDSAETFADDVVADIYLSGEREGFRVSTIGFDFSMLGGEKEMFAGVNMERLLAKLRSLCPNTAFIDDHADVSPLLDAVWEADLRTDSRMERSLLGGIGFSRVTSTSNIGQFTKYSRFRHYLNEKHETTDTADR